MMQMTIEEAMKRYTRHTKTTRPVIYEGSLVAAMIIDDSQMSDNLFTIVMMRRDGTLIDTVPFNTPVTVLPHANLL